MRSFSAQLKTAQDNVTTKISQINRKIMIDLDAKVVKRTPVDTGRAKGNWLPSIGAPLTTAVDTLDKTGSQTISIAQALHDSSTGFEIMYLTNNLPYIEALENGHSKIQAPQGMAKLSVQEIAKQFK